MPDRHSLRNQLSQALLFLAGIACGLILAGFLMHKKPPPEPFDQSVFDSLERLKRAP